MTELAKKINIEMTELANIEITEFKSSIKEPSVFQKLKDIKH